MKRGGIFIFSFLIILLVSSFAGKETLKGVWEFKGGIYNGKKEGAPTAYTLQRKYDKQHYEAFVTDSTDKPEKYEAGEKRTATSFPSAPSQAASAMEARRSVPRKTMAGSHPIGPSGDGDMSNIVTIKRQHIAPSSAECWLNIIVFNTHEIFNQYSRVLVEHYIHPCCADAACIAIAGAHFAMLHRDFARQ